MSDIQNTEAVPVKRGRGRPKGSKNKPKVVQPVPVSENKVVDVPAATKHYIWENMQKMTVDEIAANTKLTVEQVEKIATSSELDTEPVVVEGKSERPEKIRRFVNYKGATMMTPAQSTLDDRKFQENLPSQAAFRKAMGDDLQVIERRQVD